MFGPFRRNWRFLAVIAPMMLTVVPLKVDAADPASRGKSLALLACTYCHVVEDNQQMKPVIAIKLPTFQEIADDPATTAQSLRLFLRDQHTEKATPFKMPDPALTDQQIEDLVAYILSRRQLHRINAITP